MSRNRQRTDEIARTFPDLGFRPMFKMVIRRVKPKWCAGYLETIDAYDHDDISFESIRAKFGGGKFYIKVQDCHGCYLEHRTMHIAGEPMKNGRVIYKSDIIGNPVESLAGHHDDTTADIDALREQIATMTAQVEELAERVGEWEERQEEAEKAVHKALEMITELGEEDASAHALAQLRDRSIHKGQKNLEAMIVMVIMAYIAIEST